MEAALRADSSQRGMSSLLASRPPTPAPLPLLRERRPPSLRIGASRQRRPLAWSTFLFSCSCAPVGTMPMQPLPDRAQFIAIHTLCSGTNVREERLMPCTPFCQCHLPQNRKCNTTSTNNTMSNTSGQSSMQNVRTLYTSPARSPSEVRCVARCALCCT